MSPSLSLFSSLSSVLPKDDCAGVPPPKITGDGDSGCWGGDGGDNDCGCGCCGCGVQNAAMEVGEPNPVDDPPNIPAEEVFPPKPLPLDNPSLTLLDPNADGVVGVVGNVNAQTSLDELIPDATTAAVYHGDYKCMVKGVCELETKK